MVVGAACGLGLPERTVLTKDGGSVEYPRPRIEARTTAQARLATLLAGYAAERLMFGEASSGAIIRPGDAVDRAVQGVLGTCLKQSQDVLRKNRDRLNTVAEVLMAEREMFKERCREASKDCILQTPSRSSPNPPETTRGRRLV